MKPLLLWARGLGGEKDRRKGCSKHRFQRDINSNQHIHPENQKSGLRSNTGCNWKKGGPMCLPVSFMVDVIRTQIENKQKKFDKFARVM